MNAAPVAAPRPTVSPKRKVASAARKTGAPAKRKKKLATPVRLMAPNKLAASGKRLKR